MSGSEHKKINLALQGGGAHGAFTWGVLDRLLEDEAIEIEGISATSAGAMNAAALKAGWVRDRHQGAREELDTFWEQISYQSNMGLGGVQDWLQQIMPTPDIFSRMVELSPAYLAAEAAQRMFSPYELNPLNFHPLRPIVTDLLDFDRICADVEPRLHIGATNVRTGKIKVFSGPEVSPDALLASACLPTLYQAVEIEDPKTGCVEAYWDGGYMGNPALFPLFYEVDSDDILIVHINPIFRDEVPQTARGIANRLNEISFNSSLLRELRAIDFVRRMIEEGRISNNEMKQVLIHSIADDELMTQLSAATKVTPDRRLLHRLRDAGRARMDTFLADHRDDLGVRSTVNLREMFD